jgi:hypothetical protein
LLVFLRENSISRYIIDPSQRYIIIEDKYYDIPAHAIVAELQEVDSELLVVQ